jgi:hypothetical protein
LSHLKAGLGWLNLKGLGSLQLMQASSVFDSLWNKLKLETMTRKASIFMPSITDKSGLSYQANWSVSNYVIVGYTAAR